MSKWKNGDPQKPPPPDVLVTLARIEWPEDGHYGWADGKKSTAAAAAVAQLKRDAAAAKWDAAISRWVVYADPDRMVEVARDPKHPAHDQFEWNNAAAAAIQRHDRAVWLDRNVVTITLDITQAAGGGRRSSYRVEIRSPEGDPEIVSIGATTAMAEPSYRIQVVREILGRVVRDTRILADHVAAYPWLAKLVREAEIAWSACGNAADGSAA